MLFIYLFLFIIHVAFSWDMRNSTSQSHMNKWFDLKVLFSRDSTNCKLWLPVGFMFGCFISYIELLDTNNLLWSYFCSEIISSIIYWLFFLLTSNTSIHVYLAFRFGDKYRIFFFSWGMSLSLCIYLNWNLIILKYFHAFTCEIVERFCADLRRCRPTIMWKAGAHSGPH